MDVSLIVKERLRDICPRENVSNMDVIEVEKATNVAFKIIGYNPENFDDDFRKSWENSDAVMLWEFIFDVWRNGHE